jgi:hypothetical protein
MRLFKNTLAVAAYLILGLLVNSSLYADETDDRRLDISVSIFPRVVAVDNHFREKLTSDKKAYLLFVYEEDEDLAQELAGRIGKDDGNIGGMSVVTRVQGVTEALPQDEVPSAIFLVERLSNEHLEKVINYAESTSRLVFSPFSGDVERGVMVGISVTNRVKPYFNLSALRRSKVVINALLMKMSKRYE